MDCRFVNLFTQYFLWNILFWIRVIKIEYKIAYCSNTIWGLYLKSSILLKSRKHQISTKSVWILLLQASTIVDRRVCARLNVIHFDVSTTVSLSATITVSSTWPEPIRSSSALSLVSAMQKIDKPEIKLTAPQEKYRKPGRVAL